MMSKNLTLPCPLSLGTKRSAVPLFWDTRYSSIHSGSSSKGEIGGKRSSPPFFPSCQVERRDQLSLWIDMLVIDSKDTSLGSSTGEYSGYRCIDASRLSLFVGGRRGKEAGMIVELGVVMTKVERWSLYCSAGVRLIALPSCRGSGRRGVLIVIFPRWIQKQVGRVGLNTKGYEQSKKYETIWYSVQ